MRPITASELLSVWERGRSQPPHQQALLLLAAVCPETKPDDLARISIGRRDSRLLTLRERLFGPCLESMADCPACGEQLELSLAASDIRVEAGEEQHAQLSLEMEGYEVFFRLPDSNDLAALANGAGPEGGRSVLLKCCLTEIWLNGKEQQAEELPAEIAGAITKRMSEADPQADVKLSLNCPICGHDWLAIFDILTFLWSEIEIWARRMLLEIHILARSYGWREADILAMSALRRQCYLEMLGA